MSVILKFTFPAGRYHATPWGRHVNEGVPEWPPSPWRILRALVAVWKRTLPNLSEEQIEPVLKKLTTPPRFNLPAHRFAHSRHYMPWEKKAVDDRTMVFDTFVSVNRADSLFIGWPEVELSADERRVLTELVGNLTSLGRAEGWIEGELCNESVDLPIGVAPAEETNPVQVFCADSATAFSDEHYPPMPDAKRIKKGLRPDEYLFDCPRWHLCLDTETIHKERWSTVPGARWINYTRPAESAPVVVARRLELTKTPQFVRYVLDGPVLPLVIDTLLVAEKFRSALMGCFGKWCERNLNLASPYLRDDESGKYASSCLSGKDKAGGFLTTHGHAHFIPVAIDADPRRIRELIVYAPDGFGAVEMSAMRSMRTLKFAGLKDLGVQVIEFGTFREFGRQFAGTSKIWTSVTPFLGHEQIGQRDRIRYLRKGIRREWRRLAEERAAYRNVELVEVIPLSADDDGRRDNVQPTHFVRARVKHGGRNAYRAAGKFRLIFSEEVSGPLSLGYGSHFGMGRFAPVIK